MSIGTDLKCVTSLSCVLRPVQQLSSEVVVGAQCGSAVLRGAHVFVPGILACPKRKHSNTHVHLKYTFSYSQHHGGFLTCNLLPDVCLCCQT